MTTQTTSDCAAGMSGRPACAENLTLNFGDWKLCRDPVHIESCGALRGLPAMSAMPGFAQASNLSQRAAALCLMTALPVFSVSTISHSCSRRLAALTKLSLHHCGFINVASSIESCTSLHLLELARVSKAPSVAALKGLVSTKREFTMLACALPALRLL